MFAPLPDIRTFCFPRSPTATYKEIIFKVYVRLTMQGLVIKSESHFRNKIY